MCQEPARLHSHFGFDKMFFHQNSVASLLNLVKAITPFLYTLIRSSGKWKVALRSTFLVSFSSNTTFHYSYDNRTIIRCIEEKKENVFRYSMLRQDKKICVGGSIGKAEKGWRPPLEKEQWARTECPIWISELSSHFRWCDCARLQLHTVFCSNQLKWNCVFVRPAPGW